MSQFMIYHDQIEAWLRKYRIHNYTIHPNGVVDVSSSVIIQARGLTSIPVQFGRVNGNFNGNHNNLTSLVGCPYYVGGNFTYASNKITSLSGIHKLVKHIGGGFSCDGQVTNILGLMLIDGLYSVLIDNDNMDKIMNKHLHNGRDVLLCQNDLLEAGYTEQAKL